MTKVYFCDHRGDMVSGTNSRDSCKVIVNSQNTQFIQDDRSIRPFFFSKIERESRRKVLRQWLVLYDMRSG